MTPAVHGLENSIITEVFLFPENISVPVGKKPSGSPTALLEISAEMLKVGEIEAAIPFLRGEKQVYQVGPMRVGSRA